MNFFNIQKKKFKKKKKFDFLQKFYQKLQNPITGDGGSVKFCKVL